MSLQLIAKYITMKKITIATGIVGLLSAILALFNTVFAGKSTHSASAPAPVTISVGNNSDRMSGVTAVNEAGVVNVANNFFAGSGEGGKSQKVSSALVGRWKGTTRQVLSDAELTTDGHMQFQQNGAFSFSGEFVMRSRRASGEIESVVWTVAETGTWSAPSDSTISLVATDLKSLRTVLHLRDKTSMDIERDVALALPGMPAAPRYRLEDFLPKGASQEYLISELTPTTLRATGKDIRGVPVEVVAVRQP